MDSHEKLSKLFNEYISKKAFNDFDVLHLVLAWEGIVPQDDHFSDVLIKKASETFVRAIGKGKHPTLNPFIDNMMNHYDEENPEFLSTFSNFLIKEGEFESHPLDNKSDYLKITCKFDILFGNLQPFVEEKEIKFQEAEIQTALFRLNLGESDNDQDQKKKDE